MARIEPETCPRYAHTYAKSHPKAKKYVWEKQIENIFFVKIDVTKNLSRPLFASVWRVCGLRLSWGRVWGGKKWSWKFHWNPLDPAHRHPIPKFFEGGGGRGEGALLAKLATGKSPETLIIFGQFTKKWSILFWSNFFAPIFFGDKTFCANFVCQENIEQKNFGQFFLAFFLPKIFCPKNICQICFVKFVSQRCAQAIP